MYIHEKVIKEQAHYTANRHIPPNHLLVEPQYYHGDGSKITLLPWPWQYHGSGSKKSSIAQKAQNCQIHSEMEEKFFTATAVVLPRPRKQCNFSSVTVVVPRLYQQMIWRIMYLQLHLLNILYITMFCYNTCVCIYVLNIFKYITCMFFLWYLRIWLQIAYTMSMKMRR